LGRRRERQGSSASIAKWLEEGLIPRSRRLSAIKWRRQGAVASAAKKVEAVYNYPYQNHATMEPLNATALYTADKCESVRNPKRRGSVRRGAEASGLPADKCDGPQADTRGGFGRRGQTDYVRQRLPSPSKCRAPGQTVVSREEDMRTACIIPVTQAN